MTVHLARDEGQEPAAVEEQVVALAAQTNAQQIAQAAIAFQQERSGHSPQAATVVLEDDELMVTLQTRLSPAEQAVAESSEGAAQVQESHRQMLANSCEPLRQEIERITGVATQETNAEDETSTGTVVQNFRLAESLPAEAWSGNSPDGCS
jgi:uncharacterized protein YbcI